MNKRKTTITVICGIIMTPLLAQWIVQTFNPWSRINCTHQEINIVTGHMRISRYLWYIRAAQRVMDTTLSQTVGNQPLDDANNTHWHPVNTFSPRCRNRSPHYRFHGAFGQIRELEMILNMSKATEEQCVEAARGLLAIWQEEKEDFKGRAYLHGLREKLGMPL